MKNDSGYLVLFLAASVIGLIFGDVFIKLLVIALLGVMCHFFMAQQKQTLTCTLVDYFLGAFKNTLASLGACVMAVFSIVQSGHAETLNYVVAGSAFSVGYMLDSTFNRPPA